MKPIVLFSLLLVACHVADAVEAMPTPFVEPSLGEDLSRVDVRGTTTATEAVLKQVRSLTPAQRSKAAESLRVLTLNCPYTRATVQVPLAVHRVVMGIDPEGIDAFVRRDWAMLQRGLTAHVAIFDALEADLPLPETADYLFVEADTPVIVTREALLASPDPLAATWPLVEGNERLVEGYDQGTRDHIEHHIQRMREDTLHPWALASHTQGWMDALRRIEPFVSDANTKAAVRDLIDLLDAHSRQGC